MTGDPCPDVKILDAESGRILTLPCIRKTDEEWRSLLSPESYEVTRRQGTEYAFSGIYYSTKAAGLYKCICCGTDLFRSEDKYDSGSGWPSFFRPVSPLNIITRDDTSHGMQRTEVRCSRCEAHLGHLFTDGPQPTGLRFCINSVSLRFIPRDG